MCFQRDHIRPSPLVLRHWLTHTGDSIPHVIAYIFPSLADHAVLNLLVDRHFIIIIITIAVSFPLSLHRDIAKLSKSSSFGESIPHHPGKGSREALISMMVIVTAVVFRGVAVDPSLRGDPTHVFSFIRPGIFQAIGVISFAVSCAGPLSMAGAYTSSYAITTLCSSTNPSRRPHSTGQLTMDT